MKNEDVCTPSEDIVAREIEGELIIVPLTSGIGDMDDDLYTFNATGRAVWDLLDGNRTIAEIVRLLQAAYDAPFERIESDVKGLLAELHRRRIVVTASVPAD